MNAFQPNDMSDPSNWKNIFIATLANTANIRAACIAAGISRTTAYNHKKGDAEFAEAWDEAMEEAIDTMEAAALKRGRDGTTRIKPIYQNGKKVGEEVIVEYSDPLLLALLKAYRPQRFRETVDHNHSISLVQAEIDKLAQAEGLTEEERLAAVREAKRIMGLT